MAPGAAGGPETAAGKAARAVPVKNPAMKLPREDEDKWVQQTLRDVEQCARQS